MLLLTLLTGLLFLAAGVTSLVEHGVGHRAGTWFGVAMLALGFVTIVPLLAGGAAEGGLGQRLVVAAIALLPLPLVIWSGMVRSGRSSTIADGFAAAVLGLLALVALAAPELPREGVAEPSWWGVYVAAFVGTWAAALGLAIHRLAPLAAAGPRTRVLRARWLLGALLALITSLVMAALSGVAEELEQANQLLAIGSAVGFLIGGRPPATIRSAWRAHDVARMLRATALLTGEPRLQDLLDELLPSLAHSLGSDAAAVISTDGTVLAAVGVDERTAAGWIADADEARSLGQVTRRGMLLRGFWGDAWLCVQLSPLSVVGRLERSLISAVGWLVGVAIERMRRQQIAAARARQMSVLQDVERIGSWELWDDTGRMAWSPGMRQLLAVDGAVPPTIDTLVRRVDERDDAELLRRALGAEEEIDLEVTVTDDSGTTRRLQLLGGRAAGAEDAPVAGVAIDITSRWEAIGALYDALAHEREAIAELERVERLRNDILAAVSHEIRTPLTTVRGMSTTLRDHWDGLAADTREELLDTLDQEAERLADLCQDLLDVDRFRSRFADLERAEEDVAAVVEAAIEQACVRFDRLHVRTELAAVRWPVDARQLERVIVNLLQNAAKYAGAEAQVAVSLAVEDQDGGGEVLVLAVEDDGPGIREGDRERIFAPFDRGSADLGHQPGTGLGLSLVRSIAVLHGGSATAEEPLALGGARVVVRAARAEVDTTS